MNDFFVIVFDPSNKFFQIIITVLLGIFVGLKGRTFSELGSKIDTNNNGIMGIRNSSLFALLGTVVTFFGEVDNFFVIMSGGVFLIIIIAYINGVFKLGLYGLNSEISALLMFFIGVLIGTEQVMLAVVIAILTGISSAYKTHIKKFANTFSLIEWSGILQLLIITALVLPLLPTTPIDPFGIFIPFDIWLLIILISAIGFVGYFFSKYFGEKRSVLLMSFLGAMVSSVATTTALAERSKKENSNDILLASGVLMAISVQLTRVFLIVILLSEGLSKQLVVPVISCYYRNSDSVLLVPW